jgi:hypothetical protein
MRLSSIRDSSHIGQRMMMTIRQMPTEGSLDLLGENHAMEIIGLWGLWHHGR